jgi:ribosomal protein L37AE/L43A
MSEMSLPAAMTSNSLLSTARRPGFLRRLVGCVLFAVGMAGFMALVNVYQTDLSPQVMTVFSILVVGLTAGAAPRASFYGWSFWIRFFVALIALPLGMFALGFFTNWQMGIGPLEPWLRGVIDPEQAVELGGAFLVAAVTLTAWSKPKVKVADAPAQSRRSAEAARISQPASLHAVVSKKLKRTPKPNPLLKFMDLSRLRTRTSSGNGKLRVSSAAGQSRSGLARAFRRRPNVQVSVYQEHRCPFCLEVVKRDDPRGVKKCEVCSTLHHADCWDVAGACQVPHLNA